MGVEEKMKSVRELLNDKKFNLRKFDVGDISWYSPFEYKDLIDKDIKTGVEIGSHLGESANDIVKSFKNLNLICIDVWDLNLFKDDGYDIPNIDNVYEQFLSNIVHYGIDDKIFPIKMSSLEASNVINNKFDFIYIDGIHDEENVYLDLDCWYSKLKNNGFICGDDWLFNNVNPDEWFRYKSIEEHKTNFESEYIGSVRRGIKRFTKENKLKLYSKYNFWWMEKNGF